MKKQRSEEITKEPKKLRKYRALNNNVILWLSLFVIFLSLAIFSLVGKENILAIAFFVFAVISTSPMLFSPIYYVFTKKGVTIVYHFGIKEEIEWWETKSITEKGSWFGGNGLPHYHIAYAKKKKRRFFVTGEIAKTHRTKRLLKKLYIKEIK